MYQNTLWFDLNKYKIITYSIDEPRFSAAPGTKYAYARRSTKVMVLNHSICNYPSSSLRKYIFMTNYIKLFVIINISKCYDFNYH